MYSHMDLLKQLLEPAVVKAMAGTRLRSASTPVRQLMRAMDVKWQTPDLVAIDHIRRGIGWADAIAGRYDWEADLVTALDGHPWKGLLGSSFDMTLLHELGHATGHESRLGRLSAGQLMTTADLHTEELTAQSFAYKMNLQLRVIPEDTAYLAYVEYNQLMDQADPWKAKYESDRAVDFALGLVIPVKLAG